jgi:hypothetical protein
MTKQIDYQVLLETVVIAATKAAEMAKQENNSDLLFAYYDILDVIKTQAEIMSVPKNEIGMEGLNVDDLLKAYLEISKQKKAA